MPRHYPLQTEKTRTEAGVPVLQDMAEPKEHMCSTTRHMGAQESGTGPQVATLLPFVDKIYNVILRSRTSAHSSLGPRVGGQGHSHRGTSWMDGHGGHLNQGQRAHESDSTHAKTTFASFNFQRDQMALDEHHQFNRPSSVVSEHEITPQTTPQNILNTQNTRRTQQSYDQGGYTPSEHQQTNATSDTSGPNVHMSHGVSLSAARQPEEGIYPYIVRGNDLYERSRQGSVDRELTIPQVRAIGRSDNPTRHMDTDIPDDSHGSMTSDETESGTFISSEYTKHYDDPKSDVTYKLDQNGCWYAAPSEAHIPVGTKLRTIPDDQYLMMDSEDHLNVGQLNAPTLLINDRQDDHALGPIDIDRQITNDTTYDDTNTDVSGSYQSEAMSFASNEEINHLVNGVSISGDDLGANEIGENDYTQKDRYMFGMSPETKYSQSKVGNNGKFGSNSFNYNKNRAQESISTRISGPTLPQFGQILNDIDFWNSKLPINIDIYTANTNTLLERWILRFEPTQHVEDTQATTKRSKKNKPHLIKKVSQISNLGNEYTDDDTDLDDMDVDANGDVNVSDSGDQDTLKRESNMKKSVSSSSKLSYSSLGRTNSLLNNLSLAEDVEAKNDHHTSDVTELMLLVQSLYSYHRLMPLYTSVKDGFIDNSELQATALSIESNNDLYSTISPSSPYNHVGPERESQPNFDGSAKLRVYKFKPAYCSWGKLHLTVVYDTACGGKLDIKNASQSYSRSPSKFAAGSFFAHSPTNASPSKNKSGFLDNHNGAEQKPPAQPFIIEKVDVNEQGLLDSRSSSTESLISKLNNEGASTSVTNEQPPSAVIDLARRRNTLGSPQPSPELHSRVLNIANKRHLNQAKSRFGPSVFALDERLKKEASKEELPMNHRILMPTTMDHIPVQTPDGEIEAKHNNISDLLTTPKSNNLSVMIPPSGHQRNHLNLNLRDHSPQLTPFPKSAPEYPMDNVFHSVDVPLASSGTKTITPRSRRISFSNNTPTELFGSLVGSYEESIISGRMSALPSKPLSFVAEIGVVATGKCSKTRLRCPKHMLADFDAYFYDMQGEKTPSAYVGTVALPYNNGKQRTSSRGGAENLLPHLAGYEIPSEGRIQVMVRNPSRTAVKVFLIPYNFRDMPYNSKTFIRQKSHVTTKPKITVDGRVSYADKSPSETPSQFISLPPPMPQGPDSSPQMSSTHIAERPRLRYAIHIPVYRTGFGDIFVGPNVRVVFSHRAPDPDEKVDVVTEYPAEGKAKYEAVSRRSSNASSVGLGSPPVIRPSYLNGNRT